jgi:hypothetical protein
MLFPYSVFSQLTIAIVRSLIDFENGYREVWLKGILEKTVSLESRMSKISPRK